MCIEQVESVILTGLGLEGDIHCEEKRKKRNLSLVRSCMWFYEHYNLGFSINKIAKHSGRTARGINKQIAKMRFNLLYDKECKALYGKIKEVYEHPF